MRSKYTWQISEVIVLALIFLFANLRSFFIFSMYPDTTNTLGQAWREVVVWVGIVACLILLIRIRNLAGKFLHILSNQKFLIAFLLISLLSITWSISWTITLHRSLVLLSVSLAGIYIATRFSLLDLLRILFWVGVLLMAISYFVAITNPLFGTVQNAPSYGAWRGVFWHKNHLGNLMPLFSAIFLVSFFVKKGSLTKLERITALPLYFFSLLLVYLSTSAAGYLIEIVLLFSFILAMLWMRFAERLNAAQYIGLLVVIIIGITIVSLNLDFIFGLLNRETSLTGRIPMWNYLLERYFMDRPWLGHGFGTIWAIEEVRVHTQEVVGWLYPVMIGDNGFIDLLLNTGLIGLISFLIYYINLWIRSIGKFFAQRTYESFFTPLFLIYTLFANLSFSLFMETEVYIWLLIVTLSCLINDTGEFHRENKALPTAGLQKGNSAG